MGWCKLQPCLLRNVDGAGPCSGGFAEADHAGPRRGYRADDDTTIPLCHDHHRDRTESRGFFAPMSKPERVAWRSAAVADLQARYRAWCSSSIPF